MDEKNYGVISDIKACMMEDVLSDEKAVRLIMNTSDVTVPAKELRYERVFPWRKAAETIEEANTYVCFEVRERKGPSKATRLFYLDVYAITHESLMRVDTAVGSRLGISDRGSRIDILADRIDYLINGSNRYTFDLLEATDSDVITINKKFHARLRVYQIRGWNMTGERIREGEKRE